MAQADQVPRRFPRAMPITETKVLSLNGVILFGRLINLSEGGARLAADVEWHHDVGTEITIAFMLTEPDQGKRNPVFARSRVVWNLDPKHPKELGVRFEEILPSHRLRIRQFVGSIEAPS